MSQSSFPASEPQPPVPETATVSSQPPANGGQRWEGADLFQRLSDSVEKQDALDSAERKQAAASGRLLTSRDALSRHSHLESGVSVSGIVTLTDVQDRLDQEADNFNASRGGAHKYNNVRRYNSPSGANWTANFGVRGGSISLRESVLLSYMNDTLLQVQTEMPNIKF